MKCCSTLSFGFACAALGAGATLAILPALERAPLTPEALAQQPEEQSFDMEAMVAQMMKLAEPGPQHEALCKTAGMWDAKVEFQFDPATPADVTYGTMECKSMMGGRYVMGHFKGEVMMPAGKMPFEGFSINGYDNLKEQYFSVWCDSMSTKAMIMYGQGDAKGKKITYEGMNNSPMGEYPMRLVVTRESDDKLVDAFWEPNMMDPTSPDMVQTGTITYTRKK